MRRLAAHPVPRGEQPPWWRDAAHWEFDWRASVIAPAPHEWPWDRALERQHLAVLRTARTRTCSSATAVAVLRPRRRPDVAHRVDRPGGRPAAGAGDADVARATPIARWPTCCCADGGVGRWPPMPAGWGAAV